VSGIVPFFEAVPGQSSYVYDARPVGDEYGWVTDPDYFCDLDDPVTIKRQVWMLVSEDQVIFHPSTELCRDCQGEGTVGHDDCHRCGGDGRDPLAGEMEALQ